MIRNTAVLGIGAGDESIILPGPETEPEIHKMMRLRNTATHVDTVYCHIITVQ
jgi:hypothetical protein